MIFILRIAVLFLLFPTFVSAELISSKTVGGNWSNINTWEKGIVPGDGDVAEILGPVVVDSDTEIGTSAESGNLQRNSNNEQR